jgi:hypothetical protein
MKSNIHVPQGSFRWDLVHEDGAKEFLLDKKNNTVVEYGHILARALGFGDLRINAMYFEFENVTLVGDAVAIPTDYEYEGVDYYNDLEASSVRDYLRVPLSAAPAIGIATDYEDYFTEGETGNLLSFYAQTSGTAGVHGTTFANGSNSKLFGVALVAAPVWADPTQDFVFARGYVLTAEQLIKPTSSQLAATWKVPFTL